jgi:hypothetical protein
VRKELHQLNSRLEEERKRNLTSGPSQEERRIMDQLAEVLMREEIMKN